MAEILSATEQVEIERACERIVHEYSRALDLGDMNAAADLFAENGSMARPMAPDQVIQGREAIRASLLTRPKTLLTKHLATNVMIDVEGRDSGLNLEELRNEADLEAAQANDLAVGGACEVDHACEGAVVEDRPGSREVCPVDCLNN